MTGVDRVLEKGICTKEETRIGDSVQLYLFLTQNSSEAYFVIIKLGLKIITYILLS